MGKFFNPDSPVMQGLSRIADLVVLNILCVICCIPVLTIGASVAALYDAAYRLMQDEGGIYKAFFRAFGSNFKQATIQWLIQLAAAAALCLSLYVYAQSAASRALLLLVVLMIVLWCAVTAWVFPLQSRFRNSVKNTMRNALLCAMAYLPRTLAMVVLNMLPWCLLLLYPSIFWQISILWLVIWFALAAFFNLQLLKKPFRLLTEGASQEPAE